MVRTSIRAALPRRRPTRARARAGFTLIELMIVVAIFSVLAAVAGTAYRKYMDAGRTAEVYAVLGEFRAKEEAYRAENSVYLGDATGETNFFPALLASGEPAPKAWTTSTPAYWTTLGMNPAKAQLYCGYVAIAGPANGWGAAGPSGQAAFNSVAPTTLWWYVNATCNNDGASAVNATFLTTSATTNVFAKNEHQ
jgi:prepilin-type N-terminal cleavage/methylation domain-containing protein